MNQPRTGTKIRLWTGRYKHKPTVDAPGLLKLVSVLSIVSIAGTLVYAIARSLTGVGNSAISAEEAIYIAVLHFLIPFFVAYTIFYNNPTSRPLILVYMIVIYGATIAGKGYLGELTLGILVKILIGAMVIVGVSAWLFASPKMRVYYALITDTTVPPHLAGRLGELSGSSWMRPGVRATGEWVANHLETLVLVGFILVCLYAFASTG